MSTLNGVGTLRYDWTHHDGGTAEATLWFVFGFLPIIPLKRQRLCVVSEGTELVREALAEASCAGLDVLHVEIMRDAFAKAQ